MPFLYIHSTGVLRNDTLLTCSAHSSTHSFVQSPLSDWCSRCYGGYSSVRKWRPELCSVGSTYRGTCSGLRVHTLAKEELEVNLASDKGWEPGTKEAYYLRERAEASRDIKSERTWYKMSGAAESRSELQTEGAAWEPFLRKSSAAWLQRLQWGAWQQQWASDRLDGKDTRGSEQEDNEGGINLPKLGFLNGLVFGV